MAREAERLLDGAGWLPEQLCTPDAQAVVAEGEADADALPAFLADDGDDAAAEDTAADLEEPEPHAAAAA
jgi:ParB family transcriptional regulator, chromosome partitioning protein